MKTINWRVAVVAAVLAGGVTGCNRGVPKTPAESNATFLGAVDELKKLRAEEKDLDQKARAALDARDEPEFQRLVPLLKDNMAAQARHLKEVVDSTYSAEVREKAERQRKQYEADAASMEELERIWRTERQSAAWIRAAEVAAARPPVSPAPASPPIPVVK